MGNNDSNRMKSTWNALARRNAMHFIATEREDWDTESFLKSGRETVHHLLDTMGVSTEKRPGIVLDLGCGVGRLSFALSDLFDAVIAVDVSDEMIKRAKLLKEELGRLNIEFHSNNGRDIDFVADSSCDLALSYIVLQHIPDKQIVLRYIKEMARVVKLNGHILFQVPVYQAKLVVPAWRFIQTIFRFLLWNIEELGLIAPEKGVAFRGTRLSMKELRNVLHASGMELLTSKSQKTTYRLCEDITLYCRKAT